MSALGILLQPASIYWTSISVTWPRSAPRVSAINWQASNQLDECIPKLILFEHHAPILVSGECLRQLGQALDLGDQSMLQNPALLLAKQELAHSRWCAR